MFNDSPKLIDRNSSIIEFVIFLIDYVVFILLLLVLLVSILQDVIHELVNIV